MTQQTDHIERFADFHGAYLSTYIQLADTKAGVLATASAALLGFLLSRSPFQEALRLPEWTTDRVISWIAVAAIAAAFLLAFFVITPRASKAETGPIFFKDVSQFPDAAAFMADLEDRGRVGIAKCRIAHCYDVAKICSVKYNHLRLAMIAAFVGALFTAIAFVRLGI